MNMDVFAYLLNFRYFYVFLRIFMNIFSVFLQQSLLTFVVQKMLETLMSQKFDLANMKFNV
jgi:hypothetical protein